MTPDELADHDAAMAWFTAERHVLRTAARSITRAEFRRYAWQLALTLQQFCQRQGYLYDWADTTRSGLVAAETAGDLAAQALTRRGLAGAYHFLGRDDEALIELERARALFDELGYSSEHAYLHSNLGAVFTSQGRYDKAIEHYWQAYRLYQDMHYLKGQAAAFEGISWCHTQQGVPEMAIPYADKAMVIYRLLDHRKGQGDCWHTLGEARYLLGQYQQAMECYTHAITVGREVGNRVGEAEALDSLAECAVSAGDPAAAVQAWDQALKILDELRLPRASAVRDKLARHRLPGPRCEATLAGSCAGH